MALYKAKTGHDVDMESDDEIEADGIQWKVTRGAPPSLASLEDKLGDVKAFYQAKIGLEVIETEGIQWIVTRGAPPSLASLEDKLDEVKALYKAKFGCDVDTESDDEIEAEGIQWKVTRGA